MQFVKHHVFCISFRMLLALAKDFQELGELCLLVLHLEVRVHCFYYLMPVATQVGLYFQIFNEIFMLV